MSQLPEDANAQLTPQASPGGVVRPCKHCGTTEPPLPNGLCSVPNCRKLRAGHRLAAKHSVNQIVFQQHVNRLSAEYKPSSPYLEDACHQLAACLERLSAVRLGSQEHQRLAALSQEYYKVLNASRPADRQPPATLADCETAEDLERLPGMARRERIARNLTRFNLMLDSMPPVAVLRDELDFFRRIFVMDGDVKPEVIAALDQLRTVIWTPPTFGKREL